MRTRQNVLYTIQNEALYIYVVRFVNKRPGLIYSLILILVYIYLRRDFSGLNNLGLNMLLWSTLACLLFNLFTIKNHFVYDFGQPTH